MLKKEKRVNFYKTQILCKIRKWFNQNRQWTTFDSKMMKIKILFQAFNRVSIFSGTSLIRKDFCNSCKSKQSKENITKKIEFPREKSDGKKSVSFFFVGSIFRTISAINCFRNDSEKRSGIRFPFHNQP